MNPSKKAIPFEARFAVPQPPVIKAKRAWVAGHGLKEFRFFDSPEARKAIWKAQGIVKSCARMRPKWQDMTYQSRFSRLIRLSEKLRTLDRFIDPDTSPKKRLARMRND